MRLLLSLLKQFRADERGVFGMIFAVMAIVLIALGGAVVDFVGLEQNRNRAQVALDAAALALQKDIFVKPLNAASIQARAQALVNDRINDPTIVATLNAPVIDITNGSLTLTAHLTVPTIFVALVGVSQMEANLISEATRKKLSLEVMMVLDNSGSMTTTTSGSLTRMDYLKLAATCAAYTLFYDAVQDGKTSSGTPDTNTCIPATGAKLVDNVKIGLVPFTMYVNVGTNNASATWIDKVGRSPTANDNFDNDDDDSTPFTGTVDRLALYDAITNDNWRGCVEARPHISTDGSKPTRFYDTDDTVPVPYASPAQPGDIKSLFVPLFAPDLSESTYGLGTYNNYTSDTPAACNYPSTTCSRTETQTSCNSQWSSCSSSTYTSYSFTGPNKGSLTCSCSSPTIGQWSNLGSGSGRYRTRTNSCGFVYSAQGLSERELQERLCKYTGNISYTSNQKGPNADCPHQPIVPLTAADKTASAPVGTVINAINAMVADGGTNIHEGTAWGMRGLTPAAPFTEGQVKDEALSKVMIVMTDGENTAYQTNNLNGSYYFSAYGYPYNSKNASASYGSNIERLGSISSTNAQLVSEMNTRLAQTCTNAKAEGITIYTIGLATSQAQQSTQAVVEAMLTACASDSTKAYFPQTPSTLRAVFAKIAGELAALRIAQ